MSNKKEDYLSELTTIHQQTRTSISEISKDTRKRFWWIVGQIKRQSNNDPEIIELATAIRDVFYKDKLGEIKPLWVVIPVWTLCGVTAILVSILLTNPIYYDVAILISWVDMAIFMVGYLWIVEGSKRFNLLWFGGVVGGTIIGDILLYLLNPPLLIYLNQFYLILAVPCFYLHGRYIGGLIAGVSFDGVSRDVFYLPTLKINYQSYLSASPPARQWIFLCGGLGTVVTSLGIAIISGMLFNEWLMILLPIFLFFGELLDFWGLAGRFSGGEFAHLRRERRIIKDWYRLKS